MKIIKQFTGFSFIVVGVAIILFTTLYAPAINAQTSQDHNPTTEGQVSFERALLEVPNLWMKRSQAKQDATYLPGGKFILSGECGFGMGSSRLEGDRTKQGGIWLLNLQNSEVDERDLCLDAGGEYLYVSRHGNALIAHLRKVNDEAFVVAVNPTSPVSIKAGIGDDVTYGPSGRGMVYYQTTGGSLHKVSHLEELPEDSGGFAVANNFLVTRDGAGGGGVWRLPSFEKVSDGVSFTPFASIGDFVIGSQGGYSIDAVVSVYRISNDGVPIKVRELPELKGRGIRWQLIGHDYSESTPRIGFYRVDRRPLDNKEPAILIYESTGDDLRLVEERSIPEDFSVGNFGSRAHDGFGLSGDYTVLRDKPSHYEEPSFSLYKNGERVGGASLPSIPEGNGRVPSESYPNQLIITPEGKIFASNTYGAYLYQIKDLEGADPVEPTDPTDPSDPTPQPQQVDINALMEQYGITPLRDYNFQDSATNYSQSFSNTFFNSNQPTDNVEQRTENTYTLKRPPQTIAEIRDFQCAYNIVCEGSIETTGFGNLGPKTQAKIDEVFGQDGSVNGVQTTIQTSGMTIQEMQELINQLLQQVAELQAQLGS